MAKIETQYVLVGRDHTQRAFGSLNRSTRAAHRAVSTLQSAFLALGATQVIRSIANAGIQMERIQRGLTVAAGSSEAAAAEFRFVEQTAQALGLQLESTAEAYTSLAAASRGTNLQGGETREIFTAVAQASRALGLSADQTQGAFRAIEQIISKGNVQAEELRGQLGERLPGAFQIAARAIGVTTEELNNMLERGEVVADEFLPRFADQLQKEFGESATQAANDAQAAFNRLSTAIFNLKVAIAESGVLDAMAQFAGGLAAILGDGQGFGAAADRFEEPIQAVKEAIRELKAEIDALTSPGAADATAMQFGLSPANLGTRNVAELREELVDLEATLTALNQLQLQAFEPPKVSDVLPDVEEARTAGREAGVAFSADFRLAADRLIPELTSDQVFPVSEIVGPAFDEAEAQASDTAESIGRDFSSLGRTMRSSLERSFSDAFLGIETNFGSVLRRMAADFLSSQLISGLSSLFSQAFPSLFPTPQGRAIGGPVTAGTPYVVGERGKEMFIPRESGRIVPNHQLGGGVTIVQNIQTGLPTQMQEAMFMASQLAARAAKESVARDLGGRR